MRRPRVLIAWKIAVPLFLCLLTRSPVSAAGQAAVKSESAEVHSQANAGSDVVKTLKRGDAVVVGISIAGNDGTWCAVREREQKISLGWVLCALLDIEQRPTPATIVPVAPPPGQLLPSQPQAGSLHPADLPPMNDWEYLYMGPAWSLAGTLEFNPDQRARIPELAERAGVQKCIAEAEAAARRHGVPINRAETEKLTPEQRARQGQSLIQVFRELLPSDKRCSLNQVSFMEQVADLATPEQRTEHTAEIKMLRDQMAARRAQLSVIR